MNKSKNLSTFIACETTYQDSNTVIFGVPFDGTTSYRPGARFAMSAIRNESYSIETYSPYIDKDLEDTKVYDFGDIEIPFGNTDRVLKKVEKVVATIVKDEKFPIMVGGEHLITLGAIRALSRTYDNLHIIHLDAHTDLRDEYLGEKLSHATVMRRCHEIVGDNKIFQFGIRSGEKQEFEFSDEHCIIQKFNLNGIEKLKDKLGDVPVYFTIDLDVLDTSVFPGTGTPEAGGISYMDLLNGIMEVSKLNVVGLDMVELSPPNDMSGASTALACKTLRELILNFYKFEGEN